MDGYLKTENKSSGVHVLYHSPHWHICWYLFEKGHRKYAIRLYRSTGNWVDYRFWVSFGIGTLSFAFRP